MRTPGQGFHDITSKVAQWLAAEHAGDGLLTLFLQHTSASLTIQENADPDVQVDLGAALDRIAPEDAGWRHTTEGPDDMPSHIRSALTNTSEMIPVVDGSLGLGTWQGLYLFEHRRGARMRSVIVTVTGDAA